MRKTIALLLCVCMIGLTACTQSPSQNGTSDLAPTTTGLPSTPSSGESNTDPTNSGSAVYDAAMSAVSLPLITEATYSEDQTPIAYYSHQDILITLPDADVAHALTLDILNRIDQTRAAAASVAETAKKDYTGQSSWYPYSYAISYEPMRLDQNVLSMFGTETSFDGSPRSVYNAISANYDLSKGQNLSLRTIFHEENFADAICDLIISSLSSYGEDALFSDYESIVRSKFSTNVTVDSWYFTDTGLRFYFAPYEIAPFSAGVVVSEIPYEALGGLLRDEYFPSEKLTYSGSILAQVVSEDDTALLEKFSQFAEVAVEPESQQILIHTDGSVTNLRLSCSADPNIGIAEATVLALAGMGPSDAILIEISQETAAAGLTVTFDSFGQTKTLSLSKTDDGGLIFSK